HFRHEGVTVGGAAPTSTSEEGRVFPPPRFAHANLSLGLRYRSNRLMKHFLYDTAIGQVDGLCNNLRVTILNGAKPQRLWRHPCIHTAGTSVRDGEAGSEPVAASRNLDDVGFDNKQVACCAHDRASYGNCAGALLRVALVTVRLETAACEAVE